MASKIKLKITKFNIINLIFKKDYTVCNISDFKTIDCVWSRVNRNSEMSQLSSIRTQKYQSETNLTIITFCCYSKE